MLTNIASQLRQQLAVALMFAKFGCFVLSILFDLLIVANGQKPCIKRQYNTSKAAIVCVCNSTYCDEVPSLGILAPYQIAIYTSTRSGKRLERTDTTFVDSAFFRKDERLKINAQEIHQSIIGFGGAFTDSAGINLKALSLQSQELLLQSYFGENGLQYSIGRVPIASCDFSTHAYSYDDLPNDFELRYFGLASEDYNFKMPFIRDAIDLTNNDFKLFASPWSAPGWMKTNGKMKGGGSLKGDENSTYHITWANYYIRFLEEYAKKGIKFWGLTVQNEPTSGSIPDYSFQTMYFSAETERNFVKNHLGPALKNSKVGTNIALMIVDDSRYVFPVWPNKVYEDEEASKYISGAAVHWYANSPLFPPSKLTETYERNPDKFLLATEACTGYTKLDRGPNLGSWSRGESYAIDIIENLNNWVSGWVDWNLCLNLEGGPNWAQNYVDSPVLVNATADEFYKQPMFYAMGHFSKFLRPGSIRIGVKFPKRASSLDGVAFVTSTRQRVLVLLNRRDRAYKNLIIEDATMVSKAVKIDLEPHSITTLVWEKKK